ncbi:MAG: carboxypeptidase regulatory-like domain-containing protein [Clostridium sp.]
MAQLKQDKYGLSQSQTKSLQVFNSSIKLDIVLDTLDSVYRAAVEGRVVDINNNIVVGAVVRLTDGEFNTIKSTTTNTEGYFLFNNIKNASSYRIMALGYKKKLYQSEALTITEGQVINKTLILEDDPEVSKAIIIGEVFRSSTTTPVEGGVLYIYKIIDNQEYPYQLVFSNEYGNYMFKELDIGEYSIKVTALGYYMGQFRVSVSSEGEIISKTLDLEVDVVTALGTISGVILGSSNQPLSRADAILYKINSNLSLTPIAYTKTSTSGVYIFSGLPQGKYKVKSNYYEIIEG